MGNSILSEVDNTSISGRGSQTRQRCPLSWLRSLGSCPRAAGWSAATLCSGTFATCGETLRVSAHRKLVAVGEVAPMAGLLDFSQARPFAPAPSTANSALEGAQLVQPRHPVFGVPGAEDLPVLELMDVDGLDTQAAALCTNAHELRPLCAADGGSHHHLVAVLDDVLLRSADPGRSW